MQLISGERLQDHWSSGWFSHEAAQLLKKGAQWHNGRLSNSESRGPGFDSQDHVLSMSRVLVNTQEAVAVCRPLKKC